MILLPLLSIATIAGAQAPAAMEAMLDVVTVAVGAKRPDGADQQSEAVRPANIVVRDYAVPVPPSVIDLSCPLKTGHRRIVKLSTGDAADWRVQGAGLSAFQNPQPIVATDVPAAWGIPVTGAKWVRSLFFRAVGSQTSNYKFATRFRVIESPGEMRLMLKGRVLADEKFSVELFEPNLPNVAADNPSQWGANADAPDPAQLTPNDMFEVDLVVGEASGSKNPRVGEYRLVVTVENTASHAETAAMIAQLELTQTCLNWGGKKKSKKRR